MLNKTMPNKARPNKKLPAPIKNLIQRFITFTARYPWLMPLIGFASGLASFFLVERKQEAFAQGISILMLMSWLWLTLENSLSKRVNYWWNIELPPKAIRYITQLVQQESLYFVVPFFVMTTTWNSGQAVFTLVLIVAALIAIIEPVYYKWLAPRRWLYFSFHGITLFAVLLTTLPLLFHLPTPQSYMWSLFIAALLTCPTAMRNLPFTQWQRRLIVLVLIITICGLGYLVRPWIPPASLWLTQVAITDHINDETKSPTQKLKMISGAQLRKGIYAYTAIHAPRGLHERIYHQWSHNGKKLDKIALNIKGGREQGYRAWSQKMNFPEDVAGHWKITVMTEANQVIGVLRFEVE